jgi:hypothetical protein
LTTDWKRAIPPAGSAEPDLQSLQLELSSFRDGLDDLLDVVYIIEMKQPEIWRTRSIAG